MLFTIFMCIYAFWVSGWYDVILTPFTEYKWNFKEGDVAVLSSPKPGSGNIYC